MASIIPERQGLEAYADARRELLSGHGLPREVGAVVIRDCLTPDRIAPKLPTLLHARRPSQRTCRIEDLLPDGANASFGWADQTIHNQTWASRQVELRRQGFSPKRLDRGWVVEGVVSLAGQQLLGVFPHDPERDFTKEVIELQRRLTSSNLAGFEETFSDAITPLEPGDVALIRRGPEPVHYAIRTPKPNQDSRFGVFQG